MTLRILSRRMLGPCVALVALCAAAPAGATAATGCTAPTLTQAFLPFGDTSWYAIAPGEKYDSFTASGWVLTGGATVSSSTLYDGTRGYVLTMPTGATATSPAMCIANDYPTARAMVRAIGGAGGLSMYVAYLGLNAWGPLQGTGTLNVPGSAWSASRTTNVHPARLTGWQLARFSFTATGNASVYQLYNFYVDPRMH